MSLKLHKSQKFLYFCLFFIVGIFVQSLILNNLQLQAAGFLIYVFIYFFIIFFAIVKNFKFSFLLVCIFCFSLGAYRLENSYIQENNYFNEEIEFQGIVIKDPDIRTDSVQLTLFSKQFKGHILVKTGLYPEYDYGDSLAVKCFLKQPEEIEDFSYDKYLARYNIYSICSRPQINLIKKNQGNFILASIFKFKKILKNKVNKIWLVPSSSFMAGILLGLKKELPDSVSSYFKNTGTIHILVISGLHVLIISSLISESLKHIYIPRQKKIYFMALILGAFVILTGASPSVTRAVLMALVVLLAEKVGRSKQIFNVLVLVATLMLVVNPKILVYDMGFQLSFLATIGLVYLSSLVEKFLFFVPKILGIKSLLAASLSAIVLTNPLILYNFQNFSAIAPLANLIIVPFIPIIMMAGLAILAVSFLFEELAIILGWGVMLLINFLITAAKYLAGFSWSSIKIENFSWVWLVVIYGVVLILIPRINSGPKYR